MPEGMSFVKLEGNYVISFRDMNEALPAFTAVKLDRRRGSWDSSMSASTGNLAAQGAGAGPRRGSVSVLGIGSMTSLGASVGGSPSGSLAGSRLNLGDDLGAAAAAANRRRSSLAVTPFKLVLTGVPRSVREDVIRTRLETVIAGIERVYRDPDMARNLSHPPVFVETRSALAQDAFMLRSDWVAVMQRLIKEANAPAASADEGLGSSIPTTAAELTASTDEVADEERRRRQSLVDTLVTCPHGRYNGQATCLLCRSSERRNTMVADDLLGHVVPPASGGAARPLPGGLGVGQASAPAAAKPSKSTCASCMACLRRFVPGRRRKVAPADEDDHDEQFDVFDEGPPKATLGTTKNGDGLLDPGRLAAIRSQRRLSVYNDMPSIKVDGVDGKP